MLSNRISEVGLYRFERACGGFLGMLKGLVSHDYELPPDSQ